MSNLKYTITRILYILPFIIMEDQLYNHVCVYLYSKTYQSTNTSLRKKIRRYAAEMILKKHVLYKLVHDNCVLVIKREQVANILKECHDDMV